MFWRREIPQIGELVAFVKSPGLLNLRASGEPRGGLRGPSFKNDFGGALTWNGYSKGDLTGAAWGAYRAAHSCLWDWELCRPPEGLVV